MHSSAGSSAGAEAEQQQWELAQGCVLSMEPADSSTKGLTEAPRGSQQHPGAHRGTQGLTAAPRGSQPAAPRGSLSMPCTQAERGQSPAAPGSSPGTDVRFPKQVQ